MISLLGHIPTAGETVRWHSWRFEVLDMDGLRVDKVLISDGETSSVGQL